MHTDVNAAPHAGLGYHVLRVQGRRPEKEEVEVHQVQRGHQRKRNHRTIDRQNDVVRSHLQVQRQSPMRDCREQTGAKAGFLVLVKNGTNEEMFR